MRLCVKIGKWHVISIYSTPLPMEVQSPLHTGFVDG